MGWLKRLFAAREIAGQPYGIEVLCSNWVAHPMGQSATPQRASGLERLREADAVTFLARIYACQRC